MPVNQIFGVANGLGFSVLTFDWAQIGWIGSPLMGILLVIYSIHFQAELLRSALVGRSPYLPWFCSLLLDLDARSVLYQCTFYLFTLSIVSNPISVVLASGLLPNFW